MQIRCNPELKCRTPKNSPYVKMDKNCNFRGLHEGPLSQGIFFVHSVNASTTYITVKSIKNFSWINQIFHCAHNNYISWLKHQKYC